MRVAHDSVTLFFLPILSQATICLRERSCPRRSLPPSCPRIALPLRFPPSITPSCSETPDLVRVDRFNEVLAILQPPMQNCSADPNVLFHTGRQHRSEHHRNPVCGSTTPPRSTSTAFSASCGRANTGASAWTSRSRPTAISAPDRRTERC